MKSTFFFLLCAVVIIFHSIGTRGNVNSSYLEDRTLDGQPANQERHTYIASLQLNGVHICSSGLFQEGFLITTGACAYLMLNNMTKNGQTGTAVLRDLSLDGGQRVLIMDISYSRKKTVDFYDLGLVMLPDTVDYTHIEILPLYTQPIDLRYFGSGAVICGRITVLQDDVLNDATGDTQYADDLHCSDINLLMPVHCQKRSVSKDFRRKLICGQVSKRHEKTTVGDVGGPLIKNIVGYYGHVKYIIGVTLPRYQNKKGIFFDFIRMNYGFPFIEEMTKNLQCHEVSYTDNIGSESSAKNLLDKPSKRLKVERGIVRRTVHTGKESLTDLR